MNKKTIILFLLGLIVLGLVGVYLFCRPLSINIEQVFPSKVLIYARFSHVEADLNQFSQSVFWKNVSTVNWPKVLEHNSVSVEDVKNFQKMQKEAEFLFSNSFVKKFFGSELAVGIYDQSSVLFATRLGFSFQMAELFVSMAHQWADDITTTTEKYNGFKIIHVHFKKRQLDLQYVRIRDVLLLSLSHSNILHQALDVYQKKQLSLSLDKDFSKAVLSAYIKGHEVLYINIQAILGIFKKNILGVQNKNIQQVLEMVSGFKSYTVSFLPGDVSKIKFIMHFEPLQLNHYWQSLLSCSPSANTSLRFAPHNVVVYNWGQCYDFKELLTSMNKDSLGKVMEGVEKVKHRIEKRFKLNIQEDVLPILGSQVGWYLNDVDTQGLFPYPRGVAFIKIKDRLAAEKLMERFAQKAWVLLQQEDYQESLIHYITLPLGANMDPGYAFLGDYLLLGSSRQLLKTSIDAFNNSNQSLESSESLKELNIKSSETNQGVIYLKIDETVSRLQQVLAWYNKTVSSQIQAALAYSQEVEDKKKELEEAVVSKKQEFDLAQKNLKNLRSKELFVDGTDEEKANQQENMDHLASDIKSLQEDVGAYQDQSRGLQQASMTYKNQAEFAKTWLFNSDEVFTPFLKAFESFHALGMKWSLNGQVSEMEMLIK